MKVQLKILRNTLLFVFINWVHLKKSRIIFFVFVTYWQPMVRFRKNDFFKWAHLYDYDWNAETQENVKTYI